MNKEKPTPHEWGAGELRVCLHTIFICYWIRCCIRFCRPHPHRRTHFALRGQCGAGRNTGEYFLGVPHIHTRWEYIGSSVRDSWWNICGMLGDGTCRNVECISNLHPAYEDYKKRTISYTWNRSRKDRGCAFVFCKSLGTVIMPRHSWKNTLPFKGRDESKKAFIDRKVMWKKKGEEHG